LVSFFVEYGVVGVVTTGGATVMFRKFNDSWKGVLAIFLGTWLANGFSPFVFAALPFVWFHFKFGDGKDMLAYGFTETRGRSLHTLWRYGFHLFYFGHIYALYVVKKLVFEAP